MNTVSQKRKIVDGYKKEITRDSFENLSWTWRESNSRQEGCFWKSAVFGRCEN
jgi:hypothetical protein